MAREPAANYPIAAVLEELGFENVPRVRGGGYRKVACAFHGDRNPSASVSQYGFRCFTCGRTGDALKLLMEEEGVSFADAKRRAEEIAGGGDRSASQSTGWGSSPILSFEGD